MTEIALAADFALIIVVATAVGLLTRQFGQPTIIAYIIAGVLLGPVVFDVVAADGLVETMAELGLAFLLFLLGIKMRLEDIRHILNPVVKVSLLQLPLVWLAGFGLALAIGFSTVESLIVGLAVMYSSTAVVIKMLTEKDEVTTLPGMIDVGILLVQDIAVVVLLAVLAAGRPDDLLEVAINLGTVLVLIGVIGLVALGSSRYILPQVFRRIADDKTVFFLVSIAWAFLFVLIADELDLSIEMGAFLAGLAIAQLPYSEELQDRVTPLTDLFILIFFVSIGLQLGADDLLAHWEAAVIATVALMLVKFAIFFVLIDWQQFSLETTFLGSINMIQVSEFGLVLGAVAVAGDFIDESILGFLSVVALLSMGVSVYLIRYNAQLFDAIRPALGHWDTGEHVDIERRDYRNHVVAIGYDEITRSVLPILEEAYGTVVVIDRQTAHVDELEATTDYIPIFGDFRHGEVRKAANVTHASFILSSSVEAPLNELIIEEAASEAITFVEADSMQDARDLYDRGADYVILSTHLTADKLREYLQVYLDDRDRFFKAVSADLRAIATSNQAAESLLDVFSVPEGEGDG